MGGWTGADYGGTAIDTHVGYEGALGETASYYVQAGATTKLPDAGSADTVPSGGINDIAWSCLRGNTTETKTLYRQFWLSYGSQCCIMIGNAREYDRNQHIVQTVLVVVRF